MKLKIYHGNVIDDCYGRLFSDLSNFRDGKAKHIIITPDRMTLNCEQKIFKELKEKCFFDVEVMTLSRLSNKFVDKVGDKHKILTKTGAISIVKKILLENNDQFDIFEKACKQDDFALVMFETISMLKSCLVTSTDIQSVSKNNILNKKLEEIKLVYEKYEEFLKGDYIDSFNRLSLFASLIKKDSFSDTHFYFIGYNSFTPQINFVLSKILESAISVSVSVCDGGKSNSNLFKMQEYGNLISLTDVLGCPKEIIECSNSFDGTRKTISENLFDNVSGKPSNNYVEIFRFNDLEDEIEFVAKKIKNGVVLNKDKYKNFTIIASDLKIYKTLIDKVFKKYDIPAFFDVSENFSDNLVVRYIKSVLETTLKDDPKSQMELLKSPLSELLLQDVFDYENKMLKMGIHDCFALKNYASKEISVFIQSLQELSEIGKCCGTVSDFVDFVRKVFVNLKIQDRIDTLFKIYSDKGDFYRARIISQISTKLDTLLAEIEEVLASYECDAKMFLEIYYACGGVNLSLPPIVSDSVFIGDYNNSFIQPNDYLFVIGASEGSFPAYKMDSGLISDVDIDELNKDLKIGPTIKQINGESKFKAYESLLKADKKLSISYCTGSDNNFPSSLIIRLKNMFNDLDILDGSAYLHSPYLLENDLSYYSSVVFNNICEKCAEDNFVNALSEYSSYNTIVNYIEYFNTLYNSLPKAKIFLHNKELLNTKEKVSDASKLFFGKGTTSVSQFERFYCCPYKHFVDYGIRLKRREVGEIEPLDFGNILHEYASKILPLMAKDRKIYENYSMLEQLSNKVFDEILMEEEYSSIALNPDNDFTLKSLRKEIVRIAEALSEDLKLSKYEPKFFEKEFISKEAELNVDGVFVKLKGLIDRIDVFENKFRIIDYKTGSEKFENYTPLVSGRKLQLFIYERAVRKETGYRPVGVFYMTLSNSFLKDNEFSYRFKGVLSSNIADILDMDSSLNSIDGESKLIKAKFKDGTLSTSQLIISSEEISRLGDFAFDMIKEAMKDIYDGDISPFPLVEGSKPSVCTYCRYKGMCMFNEERGNTERKVKTVSKCADVGGTNEEK